MSLMRAYSRTNGNKLGARKVIVDGIEFASKREANRYTELKLKQEAGEIFDLKMQVPYELIPAQREPDTVGVRGGLIRGKVIERALYYYADFVYLDKNGDQVVEDAKGYKKGAVYGLFVCKRKLMLAVHNIRVIEV
jgi:hypothetical protein